MLVDVRSPCVEVWRWRLHLIMVCLAYKCDTNVDLLGCAYLQLAQQVASCTSSSTHSFIWQLLVSLLWTWRTVGHPTYRAPGAFYFASTPMVHIPRRHPRMQYLIQWSVHLERRSVSLLNEVWESSERRGDRCSLLSLQLTGAPVMWDPLCEGMQTLFCRNQWPAAVLERWWWWSLLMVLLTVIYIFKTKQQIASWPKTKVVLAVTAGKSLSWRVPNLYHFCPLGEVLPCHSCCECCWKLGA